MHRPAVTRLMAICFFLTGALAPAAFAATRSRIEAGTFSQLSAPLKNGAPVKIKNLPLVESNETIIVEEFDVLAPTATVEVFDDEMKPHRVTPTPMRQFRGSVVGDPSSVVYLSVTKGTKYDGIIISRDRKFQLWSAGAGRPLPREGGENDVFIEEVPSEVTQAQAGFMCDVEKMAIGVAPQSLPRSLATSELNVKPNTAPTGTQKSVLNIAIQTDSALYTNFSSNAANVDTFARNLVGAVSTIYLRDLSTEVRIAYLGVFTNTDPFAANGTDTFAALAEIGDYWHNTPPSAAPRSAAALLSGQATLAGVAWVQTACQADFFCSGGNCGSATFNNHYGGAYSYNGGMGLNAADRTVPNPDANVNYGAPASGYWPLLQLAHEFGHNVQSRHTHCTTLDAGDQVTYGRTYVDNCYTGESGCYSGSTSLPADGAGTRGTIMSYCHLLAGLGNNTRYTLGQAGEASHKIKDLMRAQIDSITPSGLSAITAPSSVPAGVGGQAASVTNTAGMTFDWTITNGTFTGGATIATGASVTFTGNTNPVTLKVYMTNASGCTISDTKSVSIGAAGPNAPTGLLATASSASSVTVTWTTVAGATGGYNVYRSTDNTNFTLAGNTAGPPFIDGGRSANTAYMYKVRATNGTESSDSNKDFAVTVAFTDGTITATSTQVKAVHFTQLRTAVNAMRALNAGQAAFSFTDAVLSTSVQVKGVHMTEIRTQLNAVRTALGFSTLTFTDTISNTIQVKKVHMDELRAGVQ